MINYLILLLCFKVKKKTRNIVLIRGLLGPDGGDGGKGGDVIVIADKSIKQLKGIKKHCSAQHGGNGQVDYCKGKKGSDLIIKVMSFSSICCRQSVNVLFL